MERRAVLTYRAKSPYVVTFSDVHVGAEEHNPDLFQRNLDWCLENKAAVFLNGDLIENAIVSGDDAVGDKLLGQSQSPTSQYRTLIGQLRPLAKAGLIFGSTRGNHEARTRRKALLDVSELIAFHLDVPYLGVGGVVRVEWKGTTFPMAWHHGRSGGKNPYTEIEKVHRLYPEAMAVTLGHNHHCVAERRGFIRTSADGYEERGEVWYVRSGSYLGYADYVREMALSPEIMGSPVVVMDPKRGSLRVDLETLTEPV